MALVSQSKPSSPPWGALFFALLGLAWCGYVAFPSSSQEPCLTSGCAITKDFYIAGLSLWWIGGAYFFLLSILCLRNMWYLAWRLSQLALFLDALLLIVMLITGPCINCLIIAVFFATTYYCLRPASSRHFHGVEPASLFFLPLWMGLFLCNAAIAGNEVVPPLSIGKTTNASVRLYFAPSCPACRSALLVFKDTATLLPVVEKDEDFEAILRLRQMLEAGTPMKDALPRVFDITAPLPAMSLYDRFVYSIGLTRNKATVLKHGFVNMPLIEINGLPRAWAADPKQNAMSTDSLPQNGTELDHTLFDSENPTANVLESPRNQDESNVLPWDTGDLSQCGQNSTQPCDDSGAR